MNLTGPERTSHRLARLATLLGTAALLAVLLAAPAHAAVGPVWDVKANWGDTNLPPGGDGQFTLQVRSIGDEGSEEALTITDNLPVGVTATDLEWDTVTMMGEYEEGGTIHHSSETIDLSQFCSGNGSGLAPKIVGATVITCLVPKEAFTTHGSTTVTVFPAAELSKPFPEVNGDVTLWGYLRPIFIDVEIDSSALGTGVNEATVSGGGAAEPFTDEAQVPFSPTPSSFGVVPGSFETDAFDAVYPFGEPLRLAGAHPVELRVDFQLDQTSAVGPDATRYTDASGLTRTVDVTLPRGFIANPEALPKCDPVDFATVVKTNGGTACPADTQVGYIDLRTGFGTEDYGRRAPGISVSNPANKYIPIYNLEPPKGTPSDLAFNFSGVVQAHIYGALDPAQHYAIRTETPNISEFYRLREAEVTTWGVPADPAHDRFRYDPATGEPGASFGSAAIRPFFTTPSDCGFDNGGSRIQVESYQQPGVLTAAQEYPDPMNVEAKSCNDPRFRFEPNIALQPTDRHAGAPTGLDVHLEVPQRNDEVANAKQLYAQNGNVKGIATPPMKKAVVTFPAGMTINPSAAQGLGSCTLAQIGLETDKPVICPDSSQYGTITIHTPILPENAPMKGFIYIAKQNENPNHNFLSLYLVIEEPERGLLLKTPGRVDLDPVTGQITTTIDDIPQFPFSDMQMTLKGGLRSGLVEPQTCGQKTIEATFYTWQDPSTPHPVKSSYNVTENPDGSPCHVSLGERPFDPLFAAGTENNLAGSFSPLDIELTRTDEDQELSVVEGTAPPGLAASLRGITQCSDAQIAAATVPGRSGTEELEAPSCPAASQVGTVDAGAGTGQVLTYVKGKIYLAGPYEGAPVSGVAIVPAVAGPFDLGTIVTRAPAYVDPVTAQISLKTDPLPLIFKGVPVRVRDIRVHLDRPDFTLNPTSCDPMSLNGTLFSSEGKSKASSTRFQAADCASLGFKPKLSFKLRGGTKRGGHPALTAVLKARPGDANIAAAQVALPYSEYLDQGHLNNICTRPDFKAGRCSPSTIYGYAVAKTPLFDQPLQGPVYLRSNPAHNLPDLVAALRGPSSLPIEVDLQGRVDSVVQRRPNGEKVGGIRNSFEVVPDAPVTEFTLSMQGGKKGLLENSENLCTGTFRASARFTAQNGKAITLRPALKATSCRGKGRRGGRGGHRAKHRRH